VNTHQTWSTLCFTCVTTPHLHCSNIATLMLHMKGQKLQRKNLGTRALVIMSTCTLLLQKFGSSKLELEPERSHVPCVTRRVMLSLHCSNKSGILSHIQLIDHGIRSVAKPTCICDSSFSQVCRDYQLHFLIAVKISFMYVNRSIVELQQASCEIKQHSGRNSCRSTTHVLGLS